MSASTGVPPIHPAKVRYIKLGEGGHWEKECLEKSIIRIGFDSASGDRFPMCQEGRWDDVAKSLVAAKKDRGTATRFANELKLFFTDDGSTLWITFIGARLYWGSVDGSRAKPHVDGLGVWRTIDGGWRSTDLKNQEQLTKDRLSGALTKLAAYRGTSCRVDVEVADYLVRRINGEKTREVERATAASEELRSSVRHLMTRLTPGDFETLVDLIFSTSGWRRLGPVGRTEKTLDLDLILPSTGERAFVQVKSKTALPEFADYLKRFEGESSYDRMFYVFHSQSGAPITCDDPRVTVIGADRLADSVMEAGLASWVIRKAL